MHLAPGSRPAISIIRLAEEMHEETRTIEPVLEHLGRMKLIMPHNKLSSDFKLTLLGLQWDMMPR